MQIISFFMNLVIVLWNVWQGNVWKCTANWLTKILTNCISNKDKPCYKINNTGEKIHDWLSWMSWPTNRAYYCTSIKREAKCGLGQIQSFTIICSVTCQQSEEEVVAWLGPSPLLHSLRNRLTKLFSPAKPEKIIYWACLQAIFYKVEHGQKSGVLKFEI